MITLLLNEIVRMAVPADDVLVAVAPTTGRSILSRLLPTCLWRLALG